MMKLLWLLFLIVGSVATSCTDHKKRVSKKDISGLFLLEVKRGNPTDSLELELASLDKTKLSEKLDNDAKRKAFWLNIYNAWFQVIADKEEYGLDSIFIKNFVSIAGDSLSFDEIEHGILRAKPEYDLLNLALDTLDYRIHFALNCGAKSCPPIAFYEASKIDQQLEAATKLYLTLETDIDESSKEVHVTKLMEWFAEDFGGEEAIPTVLAKYIEKDFSAYSIQYKFFDWTQKLGNFTN